MTEVQAEALVALVGLIALTLAAQTVDTEDPAEIEALEELGVKVASRIDQAKATS